MSKSNQNQARDSAKNLMNQATTETNPIISQSGNDSIASREDANKSLGTAGDTLKGAGNAYSDMATTGGFNPGQESDYINRATSAATSAGNVASDQARLAAAKTGQGNPQAAITRIARQMGQNASEGAVNAEAGLHEQENANKLAGAGGLVNTGQAQTGIGQTQANMAGQSAQERLSALGLQFNSEAEAQDALDKLSNNPGIFDNLMRVGTLATNAIGVFKGKGKSS